MHLPPNKAPAPNRRPRFPLGGLPEFEYTLIVLLLSCASALGGERFVSLKSGETNMISYGLACLVSDSRSATNVLPGTDLVLTLRNTGAKWIGMKDVSVEDFSLRDAGGQEMKIHVRTSTSPGMGYREAAIIHLRVYNPMAPQPWTLQFNSKPSMASVNLAITGIEPQEK